MIKFSEEKVLLLHQLLIEETGGSVEVRDMRLLDSALKSAYATFDGKELFPTKEEKAAKLGFGLIANHAFIDGNKRIGMHVLELFLNLNGIELDADNTEIARVGLAVASGDMSYDSLLQWIRAHEI